jgi:lysozyme
MGNMTSPELTLAKRYLRALEQFKGAAYVCPSDENTIGFGHVLKAGENFKEVTLAEAEALLDKDAEEVYDDLFGVNGSLISIKDSLNDSMRASLICFVFNIGIKAFNNSTMKKLLLKKEFERASEEFQRWIWVTKKDGSKKELKGLIHRRLIEKTLFLNRPYDNSNN